jgi:hypothetical protein
LFWKALVDQALDDTAFAHLGEGTQQSALVSSHDSPPCQGLYPTSRWHAGDVVPDSFAIPIAANAPTGQQPLLVGWYDSETQQRVTVTGGAQPLNDNRIMIGTVNITAP